MALDIPAVPITSQTIRYAKAAWDVARDGGFAGQISIPSQQLPADARILAVGYRTVDTFTDLGSSTTAVAYGNSQPTAPFTPDLTPSYLWWMADLTPLYPNGSLPLSVIVVGDGYSAGSMYIYVFYVV